LGLVAIGLFTAACSSPAPPAARDYAAKVAADRAQKDREFQTASDSPVPAERRHELLPLAYFPIDPDYDVPARLKPVDDRTVLEMPTSTGTERKIRLTAFVEADAKDLNRLFVPFNDLTSGTETYPGGRYMDLDRTATEIYEVDFNRAYHPYCYYNASYECPIPPPENRLKMPIRAGERLKQPNT
jgi:uncharacterized protein (DUF1684 family)